MQILKSITVSFSLFVGLMSFAQNKEQENLSRNLSSIQALQEMLNSDFNAISETKTVVPGKAFKFSNTMVFNSFGDENAKAQSQAIETEFGTTFNGSSWKFQVLDNQNGSQQLEVTTSKAEKQSANYNCSGAMVMSGNLISGFDFQAYLFQSKTNPKSFIILFAVTNGIVVAADFLQE